MTIQSLARENESSRINEKTRNDFIRAFDLFAPKLYRFAVLRVRSKETAQDLVSHAFLKAWEYLNAGKTIDAFGPFLYQTLRNLIVDYWRSQKANIVLLEDADALPDQQTLSREIIEQLNRDHNLQRIYAALRLLPAEEQNILYFRFVDDLPIRDISRLTGKKPNAIYVSLFRGVRRLKQLLNEKHA